MHTFASNYELSEKYGNIVWGMENIYVTIEYHFYHRGDPTSEFSNSVSRCFFKSAFYNTRGAVVWLRNVVTNVKIQPWERTSVACQL